MRRVALGGIAVLVMVVAGACIPPILGPPVQLPTPPGYQPPVIDSQSTPAPVHPGDQVSWVLQVHDDQIISGSSTGQWLVTPDDENLGSSPCTSTTKQGADVAHASITVTCTVPTIASNGTWTAYAFVEDNAGSTQYSYPGTEVTLPFTVVSGSDDHSPPQFVSSATDPTTIHPATPFTLTMVFTDQSGVTLDATNIDGVAHPSYQYLGCDDANAQITTVGTTTTIVESCGGQAGPVPVGQYNVFVNVRDGLNNWVGDQIPSITVS